MYWIFGRSQKKSGKLLGAAQYRSREWVSLLAYICVDLTAIPPMCIYANGSGDILDSWMEDFNPESQNGFFSSSESGWTNDDIGFLWLTKVFDRCTKEKARDGREYRLLIVDGHSSHMLMAFLDFCLDNRIILAIFPPHSIYRLQPLDVSIFSPLSSYYSKELDIYMFQTMGLLGLTKRDFWKLFWPAW
jgi:hypothetical protein